MAMCLMQCAVTQQTKKKTPEPAVGSGVFADGLATAYGRNVAVYGNVTRPRPGRPETAFTDAAEVGGMQKRAPIVPVPELPHVG